LNSSFSKNYFHPIRITSPKNKGDFSFFACLNLLFEFLYFSTSPIHIWNLYSKSTTIPASKTGELPKTPPLKTLPLTFPSPNPLPNTPLLQSSFLIPNCAKRKPDGSPQLPNSLLLQAYSTRQQIPK